MDGYLEIRILDPVADPARYQAELAERGLDIELSVVATGPEQVGRVIFEEVASDSGPAIETIEAPGDCSATGNCSVGIRVPVDFRSSARVVFGRTPRSGETAPAAPGGATEDEKRWVRKLVGKQVGEVRRAVAARGRTIEYRAGADSHKVEAAVPEDWYVTGAAPRADRTVVLWVAKTPGTRGP
ncbi:hypothetical protein [Asanoa siamensis]|uniref:hypothetical protein n=1 Tax=Asanoa siamensis TaxID=926357 RepID=UPI001942FEF0|nr:hypothetical protein [Asanoa siamensis]